MAELDIKGLLDFIGNLGAVSDREKELKEKSTFPSL